MKTATVAEIIRSTLATHSLWMREADILLLARSSGLLCTSHEQRVRYISHAIETTAKPRYKPQVRA